MNRTKETKSNSSPLKVVVIGTRGIPNIQGGVETHCEELYPRLVKLGCDVTIMRRSCYITPDNQIDDYKGVHLNNVYCPKNKALEAIVHSMLAVIKARHLHPDVVHVHAVGPGLCIPLARLLGMRVVATNHGPDYDRQKWGTLAKKALRLGQWCQAKYANCIIVISHVIADILRNKHNRTRQVSLIYNGVTPPHKTQDKQYIASLGLEPCKYVIAVGRFVPEKRFDRLVDEMELITQKGYKLVLAGDADHPDNYSKQLKKKCKQSGVVLAGFVKGEKLNQLMSHAALFVLPSTHEGLSISLLEAMSYSIDVLLSDIPANKLSELETQDFFHVDNQQSLHEALDHKLSHLVKNRTYDLKNYNWDHIAKLTLEVYRQTVSNHQKLFSTK